MSEKDDAILEYLGSIYPSAEPLGVIHWNLTDEELVSHSKDTTRRRLEKQLSAGLVEIARDVRSYYRITQQGLDYLDGRYRPDELEYDNEI